MKKSDYGVIAATMKARSAQYPWLKRGMLYHLISTLDSLVSQIILDMGYYSPGKQASSFKKSYDVATKDKPNLAWLDETFVHFLFKQEYSRRRTTPPPPQAITSPPQITRVLPTPVREKGNPQKELFLQQKVVPVARGLQAPHRAATTSPTVRLHHWVRLLNKFSKP
jgi:hypothetical protein